jgi:hypothetical protein
MAKREAQAHLLPALAGMPTEEELNLAGGASGPLGAGSAVERAEQALAERVTAFTEASEALRAEIRSFAAVVAEAEGRPAEPELRLVVSRETAEFEAIEEADKTEEAADRPTPAQIADFFRVHEEREDASPPQPGVAATPAATPTGTRNPARDRLYADVGGAIIGLAGAAALINFVLLK